MRAQRVFAASSGAVIGLSAALGSFIDPSAALGTSPNPAMVKDIRATGSSNPAELTNVGGVLYFSAQTGKHGRELWMSDGTGPNTHLVKNIRPGSASSSPQWLTDVNGVLFFTADDGTHGRELWTSDGTALGTHMVSDIRPGANGSQPEALIAVGSRLFFAADDGNSGLELWKSSGTAQGTKRVKDILAGADSSIPSESEIVAVGNRVFFAAFESPPVGFSNDVDLWKSDGTPSGTKRVVDMPAGGPASGPFELTNVGGTLFFSCTCGSLYSRLWISGGSASSTHKVVTGTPHPKPANTDELTDVNGTLFFAAFDEFGAGEGLWMSDGTTAGTDFLGGHSGPAHLTAAGGRLFFDVINNSVADLWTSDGTVVGTVLLQSDASLLMSAVIGSLVYYNSLGGLWYSDGTTTTLGGAMPGYTGPSPEMTVAGGLVFFTGDDGIHGTELWSYVP